jgi:hypothetical protein
MRRTFPFLAAAAAMMAACGGGSKGSETPPAATPTFSPTGGTSTAPQLVAVSTTTPGASIYYTTDGSTPTTGSTAYAAAVRVFSSSTIKAIATAAGYAASAVGTASYTIDLSDFATFCSGLQSDMVALQANCLNANPDAVAAEGSVPCAGFAVEIQAGRLVYDASHAGACWAAATGSGCAGLDQRGEPGACRLALVGQVANGSTCYDGAACPNGSCSGRAGACPGLCVPYATEGQTCVSGDKDPCASGLVCDGASGTCKAPSAAGGPCPCQPGLYCSGGTTCAVRKTSGPCSGTAWDECAIGYACSGSPTLTCQKSVGLGAPCTAAASTCGWGYHCGPSSTCVADPKVGESCTMSQHCIGGTCDAASLKCVATAGGTCSAAPGLAGVTLHDSFKDTAIDGTKWLNGAFTRGVSGGAAVLGVDVTNMRARSIRNDQYTSQISVVTGGQRVTTLQADVAVPAATAFRTGAGMIRASVRLFYSPPSQRLSFPGANKDLLVAEVGLLDDGNGLKAYRQFTHCDDASCATFTTSGIAVNDPAGFAPVGTGHQVGASAAYDTTYTLSASLDEVTGIFHWSIAGGSFGTPGVSGTANPAAYLAATPGWAGVLLAGTGFQVAQVSARAQDNGAGGGSAGITGRFDNVLVGFNDGLATAYDDFSGTAGNSGPTEMSTAKWNPAGAVRLGPAGGSLLVESGAPAPSASIPSGINWSEPVGLNTLLADVAIESYVPGSGGLFAGFSGRFYNDGSSSRADDATGDIHVNFGLQANGGTAFFFIGRCPNPTCAGPTQVGQGTVPGTGLGSGGHRLLLSWSDGTRRFTFGVDGITVVVDPTSVGGVVTAPASYGGPARAPFKSLTTAISASGSSGQTTTASARYSDVFAGP